MVKPWHRNETRRERILSSELSAQKRRNRDQKQKMEHKISEAEKRAHKEREDRISYIPPQESELARAYLEGIRDAVSTCKKFGLPSELSLQRAFFDDRDRVGMEVANAIIQEVHKKLDRGVLGKAVAEIFRPDDKEPRDD